MKPPIFGYFQDIIATAKTIKVIERWAIESIRLNCGLNPSRMKIAKNPTITIDNILAE